jgi:hypothetical protein
MLWDKGIFGTELKACCRVCLERNESGRISGALDVHIPPAYSNRDQSRSGLNSMWADGSESS